MVLQRSRAALMFMICCVGLLSTSVYGLARLDESAIEQRKAALIDSFEKNAKIRTVIKAAGICAGAAAAIGGAYYFFKHDTIPVVPEVPINQSPAELAKQVAALRQEVSSLKHICNTPNFGSIAWFKATAERFLRSPVLFLAIIEQAGVWGLNKLNTIFYRPTLAWYVLTNTQLGALHDVVHEDGQSEKHFVPGSLSQELMHHIMAIDDTSKSPVSVDIEFHKKCLVDNIQKVVGDMAGIIAFMQYKATQWSKHVPVVQDRTVRDLIISHNKTRSIQVQDIARYLFNYTNSTCAALEKALDALQGSSDTSHKLLTIMKGFFVELESELMRFKLIERENLF
jgi:hypothetical protein